jgi:dolichol-phosphate mannosyltransferase
MGICGAASVISLVIPSYNERSNIRELVERCEKALAATGETFELIIVDDNSPDGTPEEVRKLQADRPWLRLLVREAERDLSTAVIAGWRVARGEVLACMDADLQQPPELIPGLIERLRTTGAEVVVASRHVPGGGVSDWSLARRFISWTATLMATFILPGTLNKVRDPMSGYFLLRKEVIANAPLNPIGYKILLEVLAKGDYSRVEEVPFVFEERLRGGSKLGSSTVLKYLAHLARISLETGESARIVKYAAVGLTGAVVNYFVLDGLVENLDWQVPVAAAAGAGLAIVNNFVWNELFTFWEARKAEPGWGCVLRRFFSFLLFSSAGVAINVLLITLLVAVITLPLIPGIITGIGAAAVWNFFANSNATWRAWWNRKVLSRTARAKVARDIRESGMESVPCNICGSTQFVVVYTGEARRSENREAQTFRCTSEGHGDFTNIVQCRDCGLIYEYPREIETAIERQYSNVEDPTYERETGGRIRTFSKLLDRLETFARPGKLIDIGCYTGVFLDVARKRGWRVQGVEPSAWAAMKAQEKGLQVVNSPFREASFSPKSFDTVTLWDVIEHLHDPLGELRAVHGILRPGGILAMSTMDTHSLYARLAGRRWPWYMRMHFYYFTRDSMTRMLTAAGFEVLAIEHHKRIVSLRYFLEKGTSLVPGLGRIGRALAVPFGRVYITVDLGDIMNIFAVRPPPES